MDLSGLSNRSLVGRLVRAPLRLIPRDAIVPILQGPARGKRWIVGSGTHGCWLGTYERDTQDCLLSMLRPGMTFYDLGANVGFYSLLAASVVGPGGHVVAFEPFPRNIEYLQKHAAINKLSNFSLVPAAVADRAGTASFEAHEHGEMGHLASTGEIEVTVTTLDDFVSGRSAPPPDVIKIDVEGAERSVLEGARETLTTVRPKLFIAQHDQEIRRGCLAILEELDYRIEGFPLGRSPDDSWDLLAVPR